MKFLATALAFLVAEAAALSQTEKLRLVEKAIPVGKAAGARKLDQGLSITAYDSIQFNSCVSLSMVPGEEVQEQIAYSNEFSTDFQNGDLVSQKSYVLFNLCKTEYCDYDAEHLYMVELGEYMQLVGYRPQKTLDYCEACQEAEEWCLYDRYQQNDNQDQNQQNNQNWNNYENQNGGRSLEQVQYVSCDKCINMGCFNGNDKEENEQQQEGEGNYNNNNGNLITIEEMVEWVEQMAECYETGVQYNGIDLSAGFMCNEEGDGVELAVFLDNDCSLYSAKQSYSSLFPNSAYVRNSQSIVTFPFTNLIDCAADPEWASPEEMYNNDGNNNNNNNNNYEAPEANEYCQEFIGGASILPINYCEYGNDGNNNNNSNDENQNENNENNNNQYTQFFQGFSYDLTEEQSEDPYYACTVLRVQEGEESDYSKKTIYKSGNSGRTYDYTKKKIGTKSKSKGGKIAGAVIGILVAFAIGMAALTHYKKQQDAKAEPLVSEDVESETPYVQETA